MTILYIQHRSHRVFSLFPTFLRRPNESIGIPLRLIFWWVHLVALITAAQAKHQMIVKHSLAEGYSEADYQFLMRVTDLALAGSFLCLCFCAIGVLTARTLRFGLLNLFLALCDAVAGVLLIVCCWDAHTHVARIWHVFYIFSIIPTGIEMGTLLYTYIKGIDMFY
ncbi:hypothetical protein STCU_03956 [Strigomonas culicis]|uniref:Uncharacterized protein n=1 Tax=Strigomonas culicis TaxID=28005 RepID=S9UIM7_9TRYP|nr:hypothetical protein STCU_03956 [Strigomonas culicis]|eukprot:EPY30662.1 hypothetical protein STCU_03956 [Strigomonas culicis]